MEHFFYDSFWGPDSYATLAEVLDHVEDELVDGTASVNWACVTPACVPARRRPDPWLAGEGIFGSALCRPGRNG